MIHRPHSRFIPPFFPTFQAPQEKTISPAAAGTLIKVFQSPNPGPLGPRYHPPIVRTTQLTALLQQPESTTLDFKQSPYALAGASPEQKSELIKDILAFANAKRTTDAHILIGVTEQPGQPASVTGITDHLDDATLQQLINTKTNRTVQFTYQETTHKGRTLGIITIPPQQRPLYLKKDYGKLRANTVYVRHGSSTAIATPDEIARMHAPDAPMLELQFADQERALLGTSRAITSLVLHTPREIPDYGRSFDWADFNPHYYRDFLRYAAFDQLMTPLGIAITNTSSTTGHDVRITLTIPHPQHVTVALHAPPMPDQFVTIDTPRAKKPPAKPAVTLDRTSTAWHLTATIPKVQPRQTHYVRDPIYLGATKTITLTIAATVHADNLPDPVTTTLTIAVTSTHQEVTLIDALKLYNLD